MKRIILILSALVLLVGLTTTTASAGKPTDGKVIVHNSNDPGDGGGTYPLWTGDCRLTGGLYNEGWYYMWPGNQRRDKCNSGWYTVETWNGSSWVLGAYYD